MTFTFKKLNLLRISRVCLVILGICILRQTTEAQERPPDVSLCGFISDQANNPLASATVLLLEDSLYTIANDSGYFCFEGLYSGTYTLKIQNTGYAEVLFPVEVNGVQEPVFLRLDPEPDTIREVQVHAQSEFPLSAVQRMPVQLITEEMIRENANGNLIRTLGKFPGISSADIGSGLSRPVIRGLGYYRVLVARVGIPIGGQQWSNHHGLAAGIHGTENVEYIRGPAALRYGSGAMGGVINMLPHHIPLQQGLSGEAGTSFSTNNKASDGYLHLEARKRSLFLQLNAGLTGYADFAVPGTDYFLLPAPANEEFASHKEALGDRVPNTAGQEFSAGLVAGLILPSGKTSLEITWFDHTTGFFDWNGLQVDSLRDIHESSIRDVRDPYLHLQDFSLAWHTKLYRGNNKTCISVAFQRNVSSEYDRLIDRTGNRADDLAIYSSKGNLDLFLALNTYTARWEHSRKQAEGIEVVFGSDLRLQRQKTDGFSHILPEYSFWTVAGFANLIYPLNSKLSVNTGIRAEGAKFMMSESLNPDPAFGDAVFNPGYDAFFPGMAFSAGLHLTSNHKTDFHAGINRTFRFPSAYELGAYGLHRHEGRFEKGDTLLEPESAWQADISYSYRGALLGVELSPFVNYFNNYISLNPTSELRPEGQVYAYDQQAALLCGGEASFRLAAAEFLTLRTSAQYVYAINIDNQMPLPATPPLAIRFSGRFSLPEYRTGTSGSYAGLELEGVASQKYTVPNELSTPGYLILNANAGTTVKIGEKQLRLWIQVYNLLNTPYFNHLSFYRRLRISEPGRNITCGASINF